MKILFLCEAVTLSHLARPLELSKNLNNHDILVASTSLPDFLSYPSHVKTRLLENGLSQKDFQTSIYHGKNPYNLEVLELYLQEDLKVISEYKPDLLVSDYRITAAVSSHLSNIPLMTLSNFIWSPYNQQKLEAPSSSIVNHIGLKATHFLLNHIPRVLLKKYVRPMNDLREQHGLKKLSTIKDVYTAGDITAYLDAKEGWNYNDLPSNHMFLGPLSFSYKHTEPEWFKDFQKQEIKAFISLGSSGGIKRLPLIQASLKEKNIATAIASSERFHMADENIYSSDYLDMERFLPHCNFLICNGGSPSSYLAVKHGIPIIGICHNMDQHMHMQYMEKRGLGIKLRSDNFTQKEMSNTIERILNEKNFVAAVKEAQQEFLLYDIDENFEQALDLLKSLKNIRS